MHFAALRWARFFSSHAAGFLVDCLVMPTEPKGCRAGLNAVADALRKPEKILITGHLRPDGDALGSALALARFLKNAGCSAFFTAEKTQFGRPDFLEGCELVTPLEAAVKKRCDMWVALDCATVDRLPEPLRPLASRANIINIDHHPDNTRYGCVNWIDPATSCTGELVWRLAKKMKWPLDHASAEALWVSLVTDTGRFAYDHVRPATMRFAADLLQHGVRTNLINDRLHNLLSANAVELKRRAWASLDTWFDGRAALISLTRGDFRATATNKSDAEDFVDIPRSLDTAVAALFFHEGEAATHVSIRTRAPLDATRLAAQFGGGGHPRAAGCTLDLPPADAMRAVKKALSKILETAEPRNRP